jgi:hypothetical protein
MRLNPIAPGGVEQPWNEGMDKARWEVQADGFDT